MPTMPIGLLEAIPDSVEAAVKGTVNLTRAAIRDALIAECRLPMRGRESEGGKEGQGQVPVLVLPARVLGVLPVALPDNFERVLCLARHADALRDAASSTKGLLEVYDELSRLPGSVPKVLVSVRPIQETREWTVELLRHLEASDPLRRILAVDEDVLGGYLCLDLFTDEFRANRARVELYWHFIGLAAALSGATVEDLTVVVLTHELAHAFTQLGAEIKGRRWPSGNFVEADPALTEALAQYYTSRCLRRLRPRYPGAFKAFMTLLEKQPEIYRGHCAWEPHVDPEAVRQAMLEVRRARERTLGAFEERLHRTAAEFPPLGPEDGDAQVVLE